MTHVCRFSVRTFGTCLVLCAMLLALPAGARAQNASLPPLQDAKPQFPESAAKLQDIRIDQNLGQQLPRDLLFRDETGQPVRLGDYLGKRPVVLTLVYYNCPMLCTLVLNDTLRMMRAMPLQLGKDYDVLTVSFDPTDTAELAMKKKLNYLAGYRADPASAEAAAAGWHFLTGDAEAIRQLTQTVGFRYRYDDEQQQYLHPAGLVVLSPQGTITRYFYGIDYSARDVRLALVEAADGKVGTIAEQILLLCYRYNPTTGKYTFGIMSALRVGAVLIMLALGTLFVVLIRRERRLARDDGSGDAGGDSAAPQPGAA